MKKTLSLLLALVALATVSSGQFNRAKTLPADKPVKNIPIKTTTPPRTIGTVMMPPAPTGNFNNPSTVFTLPDGKRVTMTMRQNMPNLPQNIGGVVNERTESSRKESGADGSTCTVETKMLNAASSTFMNVNYNQQAINIFPGAIYRFSDFFSGNYRPLEQGRNPINISTDNLANTSGAVFRTVQNPTGEEIRQQIANIIQPFSTSTGSAGLQYRIFTAENDAELSIKLSAGGGYAGFKASGGFSTQQTEKSYYLTIDAIKPLYTITTSFPANGYFSDKNQETNNPNLIVLKSVTYGTRILANVEVNIATQKDDIDFKASFGADSGKGVSANFSATFNYLKSNKSSRSTVNVYVVGGPINTTIFDKDKLQEQITELLGRCNYQTAQPIAYSFTDINGNVLGMESATDRFTSRKCVPAGSVYKLISATLQVSSGTDTKEQGSNVSFTLVNSNGYQVYESNDNNIEFRNQNDVTLNLRNVPENQLTSTAFGNGGYLDVFMEPKQIFLGWDAWNFNGATLTLLFQDQNGAQMPYQMNFSNARAVLTKNQQRLRLPFNNRFSAGGAFMPGL